MFRCGGQGGETVAARLVVHRCIVMLLFRDLRVINLSVQPHKVPTREQSVFARPPALPALFISSNKQIQTLSALAEIRRGLNDRTRRGSELESEFELMYSETANKCMFLGVYLFTSVQLDQRDFN